ncbi:hypothetical protein DFQ28_008719, partial [Apophysomyces sp. BC1034]
PHDKSTIIGTNKATTAFATPSETTPTSTNFQTTTTASTSRTTATSSSMYAPYTKPPSVPSSGYDPLSTPSTNGVFSDEPLPSITSPITNISTGINNTAGPVPTTVNNASPGYNPESVPGSVSNKAIGIGLGVGIGCVAALGLAGLLIHNRRKQAEGQSLGESNVQTRWRPQSFMAAVAAVASRLSRTPSQRSKLSTLSESDPGRAIGTGQGAVEHPAMSYSPPSLARVEHGASNISR